MIPADKVKAGDWDGITALSAEAVALINGLKK
jgi:2-dehydro-3-deoxyphosphogluconate aldolase/(4S)-4-hydroxy-2-oxoglutarate aldolase